jgi:hypothetical protein
VALLDATAHRQPGPSDFAPLVRPLFSKSREQDNTAFAGEEEREPLRDSTQIEPQLEEPAPEGRE